MNRAIISNTFSKYLGVLNFIKPCYYKAFFRLAQLVPWAIYKLLRGNFLYRYLPCQFISFFILILLFCKVTSQILFELTNWVHYKSTQQGFREPAPHSIFIVPNHGSYSCIFSAILRSLSWFKSTVCLQVFDRCRASREVFCSLHPTKHFWRIYLELRQNIDSGWYVYNTP